MDTVVNFGKVTVNTGYALGATTVVLASGHGSRLPNPATDGEFNVTWWNVTDYPDPSDDPNREIVRVTARSTDTLTVTRGQELTTASNKNTAGKTYKMVLAITKKTIDDITTALAGKASSSHSHAQSDITNLATDLAGKASASHTHAQSDIANLATDLGNKQNADADLTTIAGLTPADDDILQRKASAWVNRTVAQFKTDLNLAKGDVGLGNVDNTSDANKPVSSATQTALNAKADTSHAHATSDVTGLDTALGNKQPLDTQLTSLAGLGYAGNALKVIRVNAGETDFEMATVSGGQTLYSAVVATSGGDYTSITDALAAGKYYLFVRNGTYTEAGAISNATNNITIIGESPNAVIISMGANNFTLSGTNVLLQNITFSTTTSAISISGTYSRTINCNITSSGTTNVIWTQNGMYAAVNGCNFLDTSVAVITSAAQRVAVRGQYNRFANNYVKVRYGTSNATAIDGSYAIASNNAFEAHTAVGTKNLVSGAGNFALFSGNYLYGLSGNDYCLTVNGASSVTGNFIERGLRGIYCYGGVATTITGNSIYMAGSTGTTYGIYLDNGYQTVSGNNIIGAANTNSVAIFVNSSCDANNISGNYIKDWYDGIKINASSCDDNVISNNNFDGTITNAAISDAGTNTRMRGNTGVKVNALLESDFRQMKNTSGGSLAAGDLVVWKAVAAGNEVTTTTTLGDDKVYGMAVATITNNSLGYIQTLGKTTLLKVDGTTDIAVGDPLTAFTTAGIACKASAGDMVFAYALEAYTANDSAGVIDALLITPRLI